MKKVGTAFLTTLFIFSSFTSAHAEEKKDSKAFIDVSAATLWTAPDSLRPIDVPSATNPVDLWKWTKSMTLDEKLLPRAGRFNRQRTHDAFSNRILQHGDVG